MLRPPSAASLFFFLKIPRPPRSTLFPYPTLFRSHRPRVLGGARHLGHPALADRALPLRGRRLLRRPRPGGGARVDPREGAPDRRVVRAHRGPRSEEHTSELQSQSNLVCRLLLEKK